MRLHILLPVYREVVALWRNKRKGECYEISSTGKLPDDFSSE